MKILIDEMDDGWDEKLKDLGFDVIHEPVDFFENDLGDIIISLDKINFKESLKCLERLLNSQLKTDSSME